MSSWWRRSWETEKSLDDDDGKHPEWEASCKGTSALGELCFVGLIIFSNLSASLLFLVCSPSYVSQWKTFWRCWMQVTSIENLCRSAIWIYFWRCVLKIYSSCLWLAGSLLCPLTHHLLIMRILKLKQVWGWFKWLKPSQWPITEYGDGIEILPHMQELATVYTSLPIPARTCYAPCSFAIFIAVFTEILDVYNTSGPAMLI